MVPQESDQTPAAAAEDLILIPVQDSNQIHNSSQILIPLQDPKHLILKRSIAGQSPGHLIGIQLDNLHQMQLQNIANSLESIKAQQASSIASLRSDIQKSISTETLQINSMMNGLASRLDRTEGQVVSETGKIDSKLNDLANRLASTEDQVVSVINQVKALAARPVARVYASSAPLEEPGKMCVGLLDNIQHLSKGTSGCEQNCTQLLIHFWYRLSSALKSCVVCLVLNVNFGDYFFIG